MLTLILTHSDRQNNVTSKFICVLTYIALCGAMVCKWFECVPESFKCWKPGPQSDHVQVVASLRSGTLFRSLRVQSSGGIKVVLMGHLLVPTRKSCYKIGNLAPESLFLLSSHVISSH